MVDIGEAVLQWRCGLCGYRVEVVSRLDDGIELFIAVVDRHIESGCRYSRGTTSASRSRSCSVTPCVAVCAANRPQSRRRRAGGRYRSHRRLTRTPAGARVCPRLDSVATRTPTLTRGRSFRTPTDQGLRNSHISRARC